MGSCYQRLFKENIKKKTKKDKEWSMVWKKGFGNRLLAGKVLAPRMPFMKMVAFNRVR